MHLITPGAFGTAAVATALCGSRWSRSARLAPSLMCGVAKRIVDRPPGHEFVRLEAGRVASGLRLLITGC